MSGYRTKPRADADLIAGARWILTDNPDAARRFLDAAFESFGRLATFPESGALTHLRNRRLAGVRFVVLPPPFNQWLVFYRLHEGEVEILRVIYGSQNWRGSPASFFV